MTTNRWVTTRHMPAKALQRPVAGQSRWQDRDAIECRRGVWLTGRMPEELEGRDQYRPLERLYTRERIGHVAEPLHLHGLLQRHLLEDVGVRVVALGLLVGQPGIIHNLSQHGVTPCGSVRGREIAPANRFSATVILDVLGLPSPAVDVRFSAVERPVTGLPSPRSSRWPECTHANPKILRGLSQVTRSISLTGMPSFFMHHAAFTIERWPAPP